MNEARSAVHLDTDAGAGGLRVHLQQSQPFALDASLDCAAGELLALVGPSGSGKTTSLRAIAGLHKSAVGRVQCGEEIWMDSPRKLWRPPQQRRVGLVFQDYALFPNLTAAENLMLAMQHVATSDRRRQAEDMLARVNLDGLADRRPAQLSGGQQQRVAIARALARDPHVLLLDEPFAAVDQVTRQKLQQELVQMRAGLNMPMVLVTHDLNEAAALSDRMVVLHRGCTLQQGAPQDVINRPCSAIVARLVGQSNVFDGEVIAHHATHTVLRWGECVLEARCVPELRVGSVVTWMIPASHVVLHRRDRPSRGERENPVTGKLSRLVVMGETTHVVMSVDGHERTPLSFSVATHAARRNDLRAGVTLTVSLLADGIHVMQQKGSVTTETHSR